MNITRTCIASLSLLSAAYATPAAAQDPVPSLPTVQAVQYVFDCEQRSLPSQRQVGAWTGQHNLSEVYATRQRLMGEIARACNRSGIEQVQVVGQAGAISSELRLVAVATRRSP